MDNLIDKIILGDCTKILSTIPDKYVDVSFTSPPYNHNDKRVYKYHDDNLTSDEYTDLLTNVTDELLRVTKRIVIINIAPSPKNRVSLYEYIGRYSKNISEIIVWYKPNPRPSGYVYKDECTLSQGYEMFFMITHDGAELVAKNSRFLPNTLVKNVNTGNQYNAIHSAVMNPAVCEHFIKHFTSKGDIVLDPFSGLGTTALVCKEYNRHYIGIELQQEYYDISVNRLQGSLRPDMTNVVSDSGIKSLLND